MTDERGGEASKVLFPWLVRRARVVKTTLRSRAPSRSEDARRRDRKLYHIDLRRLRLTRQQLSPHNVQKIMKCEGDRNYHLLFRMKANGVVAYEYFCRPNIFMYRYT